MTLICWNLYEYAHYVIRNLKEKLYLPENLNKLISNLRLYLTWITYVVLFKHNTCSFFLRSAKCFQLKYFWIYRCSYRKMLKQFQVSLLLISFECDIFLSPNLIWKKTRHYPWCSWYWISILTYMHYINKYLLYVMHVVKVNIENQFHMHQDLVPGAKLFFWLFPNPNKLGGFAKNESGVPVR